MASPELLMESGELKVHPFIYKRFIRALARAANKRKKPKIGHRVKGIPKQIYTFQNQVLKRKAPPKLLRKELNELQRSINEVINQEKYVISIHEQEHKTLDKIQEKLEPVSKDVAKKLRELDRKKKVSRHRKGKPILLPALPAPSGKPEEHESLLGVMEPEKPSFTVQHRFIMQIEEQLEEIEAHKKQLSRRKSTDKKKLAALEKTIKKFKQKLSELREKHVAG